MNQTLKQLDLLRELAESGVLDVMMELTINKVLEYEIQRHQKRLKELAQILSEFEEKHKMNSSNFYRDFEDGKLGDAMDFFEWASLYDMFKNIEHRKQKLESGLRSEQD